VAFVRLWGFLLRWRNAGGDQQINQPVGIGRIGAIELFGKLAQLLGHEAGHQSDRLINLRVAEYGNAAGMW